MRRFWALFGNVGVFYLLAVIGKWRNAVFSFCSSNMPSSLLPWSCRIGLARILLHQTSHAGFLAIEVSAPVSPSLRSHPWWPRLSYHSLPPHPHPLQPIAWCYLLHFTLQPKINLLISWFATWWSVSLHYCPQCLEQHLAQRNSGFWHPSLQKKVSLSFTLYSFIHSFIHPFTYSFNRYLLSTYGIPSTVLRAIIVTVQTQSLHSKN